MLQRDDDKNPQDSRVFLGCGRFVCGARQKLRIKGQASVAEPEHALSKVLGVTLQWLSQLLRLRTPSLDTPSARLRSKTHPLSQADAPVAVHEKTATENNEIDFSVTLNERFKNDN